jgi:hypothetical protein
LPIRIFHPSRAHHAENLSRSADQFDCPPKPDGIVITGWINQFW